MRRFLPLLASLVLLALPVFRLEIGTSGVSTLPDDLAAKQGFLAIQRDFPDQSVDPEAAPRSRRRRGSSAPTWDPG